MPAKSYFGAMCMHNGTIFLCGLEDDRQNLYQLDNGAWKEHSTFVRNRSTKSIVTTPTAIFTFGGNDTFSDQYSFEYLPKDSTTWVMGKTEIPGGFTYGIAIAIESGQEIWLIGGDIENKSRILSFNVKNHTFQELPFQLNEGRISHRCAFIPNTNKIIITSGPEFNDIDNQPVSSEIIDTEFGSISITASPMNVQRYGHGMEVVTINGENKLVVFGGKDGWYDRHDSFEIYNARTEKWETTDIKLSQPLALFGFLTVKLSDDIFKHF